MWVGDYIEIVFQLNRFLFETLRNNRIIAKSPERLKFVFLVSIPVVAVRSLRPLVVHSVGQERSVCPSSPQSCYRLCIRSISMHDLRFLLDLEKIKISKLLLRLFHERLSQLQSSFWLRWSKAKKFSVGENNVPSIDITATFGILRLLTRAIFNNFISVTFRLLITFCYCL